MILSVAESNLPGMIPNPWRRLAEEWPQVLVTYDDLGARWGRVQWPEGQPPRITLHRALNQVKRRCTIAHEIEHLEIGAPCGAVRPSVEKRVLVATARYLLPDLDAIAQALAVYDMRRAADELWVTFPVLVDRMNSLTNEQSRHVHIRRQQIQEGT